MTTMKPRILLVDDNVAIHEDFKTILNSSRSSANSSMQSLEEELFGDSVTNIESDAGVDMISYDIDDAYQGEEAVQKVSDAAAAGEPYSLIFMDVRMPPGMDGIQAIKHIWEKHPHVEVVICTAFSDYSWDEILKQLGHTNNLLFMKKPFDTVAVKQIALTLTQKWAISNQNRSYTEQLETEVDKRTRELNDLVAHLESLKEEAEAATVSKSLFLSNMSHEIRTPLNGVLGLTELLIDTELSEEQRDYVQSIKASGESLKSIVDDILDYSKVEAGKVTLETIEFDPRSIVESVADLISIDAAKKNVEIGVLIHANVPNSILGDPERLRQILLNLANNSTKFTANGEVNITVSVHPHYSADDNAENHIMLAFEVRDTGIGIAPEVQDKLFSPFVQSDESTTRKYGGTGLGLSICKQLVELMHGQIGVDSVLGEGSAFKFTAEFGVPAQHTGMIAAENPIKGIRCLQLGDNQVSLKVLSLYINHWRGDCENATDARLALEKLHSAKTLSKPFDIVIIDYIEGELEQYQHAADQFNQYKEIDNFKLLALMPAGHVGYIDKLKDTGYDACLARPIKQNHLHKCLSLLYADDPVTQMPSENIITNYIIDNIAPDHYRILVADDNGINQKVISMLLKKIGVRCDLADNGQLALEACQNKEYDIVFMDCHMPIMDGFETTAKIRSESKNMNTPIIAITADAFEENKKKCVDAGMSGFVSKPFKLQDIINCIKSNVSKES